MFDVSSTGNSVRIKLVFQVYLYILRQREFCFYTDNLYHETTGKMNKWLRKWISFRFHPMASLHSFHTFVYIKPEDTLHFLQTCRPCLDYSAQLQLNAWIQNFARCNLVSKRSDELSYLRVLLYISEIAKVICAHPIYKNICKGISHAFSCTIDLTLITLETKLTVAC
jgi:hypothetical protein